jgi:hypothetical protein
VKRPTESKLHPEPSLQTLAELFKEQLRLLGRMLSALRSKRALAKRPRKPELALEIADADLSPRVAYERDEELPATD